jgi:hypothetical protein
LYNKKLIKIIISWSILYFKISKFWLRIHAWKLPVNTNLRFCDWIFFRLPLANTKHVLLIVVSLIWAQKCFLTFFHFAYHKKFHGSEDLRHLSILWNTITIHIISKNFTDLSHGPALDRTLRNIGVKNVIL